MTAKTQHFRITQAGLIALATNVIGQAIAYVPAWAPEKTKLISTATMVITAAFLIANALHALISVIRDLIASKVSPGDLATAAERLVRDELGKVDFNQLAKDAATAHSVPDVEQLVESKLKALLAGLGQAAPASAGPGLTMPPQPAGGAPVTG